MLYLIGGPSRVGKTTLAIKLHDLVGGSLVTTDAIVWMLQVAAPQLGVRHGSETKPVDAGPYLPPFVEAATVYGSRDLILEGDALGPSVTAALLGRWPFSRGVFLGASNFTPSDVRERGGYVADLDELQLVTLTEHIRTRSQAESKECERFGIPRVDVSVDADAYDTAMAALLLLPY